MSFKKKLWQVSQSKNVLLASRKILFASFLFITSLFVMIASFFQTSYQSVESYYPIHSSFFNNYKKHQSQLVLWDIDTIKVIAVSHRDDIFESDYLLDLKKFHDFIVDADLVNPQGVQTVFSPELRWKEITEQGVSGGIIIPENIFTENSVFASEEIKNNILKSELIGRLVAKDFKSTMVYISIFHESDSKHVSTQLSANELVQRIQAYGDQLEHVDLHVLGSVKKFSDLELSLSSIPFSLKELISGKGWIPISYLLVVVFTFLGLLAYFRDRRPVIALVFCSSMAMFWQIGVIKIFGLSLSPYLAFVPFLTFSIAISHGVQVLIHFYKKANELKRNDLQPAQVIKTMYVPGILALAVFLLGFLTLFFVNIVVIKELAITASIGVLIVGIINIVFLPVVLSFVTSSQINKNSVSNLFHRFASSFLIFTEKRFVVVASIFLATWGLVAIAISLDLKIGHPNGDKSEFYELSPYYQSSQYAEEHYPGLMNSYVVMVETESGQCTSYESLTLLDQFHWNMSNIDGVYQIKSIISEIKHAMIDMHGGNIKWTGLSRDSRAIQASLQGVSSEMMNADCSMTPVFIYLNRGDAELLKKVTQAVERFTYDYNPQNVQFLLAAGEAGFEAALNEALDQTRYIPLIFIFWIVIILSWIIFRSLKASLCLIVPLILTWLMVEVFMVWLGIGITVSTLAVAVMGICLGVDYGIYLFWQLEKMLLKNMSLKKAYRKCLSVSGTSIVISSFSLATGGLVWCLSPIKFYADIGIIFCVVFIANMVGTLVFVPVIAFITQYKPVESEKHIRANQTNTFPNRVSQN